MKAARTLTTAAASVALICALPTSTEAMEKVESRNLNMAEDDVSRELMHVVSHFDNILCSLLFSSCSVVSV